MDIEPRLLRYFLMVAKELHFGRAAAKLYVSQPALSEGIKRLEADLNVALFIRRQRRVELTEAGKVLQIQAPEILRQIDQAAATVLKTAREEAHHFRIGYSPFIELSRVADLRVRLRAESEWTIELVGAKSVELRIMLARGDISVALLVGPVDDDAVVSEVLFEERYIVGLPADHRLGGRTGVSFHELNDEKVIWLPRSFNPGFYDRFVAECDALGYHPLFTSEVTTLQECLFLISDHQGITFTTASAQSLKRPGVVFVPLLEPLSVETVIAYQSTTRSAIVPRIIELAKEVFR